MITFTDTAKERFLKVFEEAGEGCIGFRVRAQKVGEHTFRYQMHLVKEEETTIADTKLEVDSFKVFLDPESVELMTGTSIDFKANEMGGGGFDIDNPAAKVSWDNPIAEKVQEVLDRELVPALASHGGWVELVKVDGDKAHVRLGGGCQGCAGARATLKDGIERVITKEVPDIKTVVDETNHAVGDKPYM